MIGLTLSSKTTQALANDGWRKEKILWKELLIQLLNPKWHKSDTLCVAKIDLFKRQKATFSEYLSRFNGLLDCFLLFYTVLLINFLYILDFILYRINARSFSNAVLMSEIADLVRTSNLWKNLLRRKIFIFFFAVWTYKAIFSLSRNPKKKNTNIHPKAEKADINPQI